MNASAPAVPLVSGQQKITTDHLQRLAYIYIRQSSPKQLLHNTESQRYQRLLIARVALGQQRVEALRNVLRACSAQQPGTYFSM